MSFPIRGSTFFFFSCSAKLSEIPIRTTGALSMSLNSTTTCPSRNGIPPVNARVHRAACASASSASSPWLKITMERARGAAAFMRLAGLIGSPFRVMTVEP